MSDCTELYLIGNKNDYQGSIEKVSKFTERKYEEWVFLRIIGTEPQLKVEWIYGSVGDYYGIPCLKLRELTVDL